jgi:hypothetical protein
MINKIAIEPQHCPSLGKIFSPAVLDKIAYTGHSPYLNEVCENSGISEKIDRTKSIGEFLDWIYNILFINYRNEYVYKNALVNKILLGRHSLNTSQVLTEFRVGRNKADVVLLNGTSSVYEIKSQYDSFARLNSQINSYFEIFDYVNVITAPKLLDGILSILPDEVGVFTLTDRNTISTVRKPKSNKDNINLATLFDSLRKEEYTRIIKNFYGQVPDVPNTEIYRDCKKLFCAMPISTAHHLAIQTLKERNNSSALKNFVSRAPTSMAAYAIRIGNQKYKLQKLGNRLEEKVNSLFVLRGCG